MLKRNFKLKRAVSDRLSNLVVGFENKEEDEVGRSEELETFHMKEFELETGNAYENEEEEEEKESKLSRKIINIEKLQSIASLGLPNEGGLRSTVWKLLLGYLPASQDLQEGELAERRLKYAKLKNELLINPTELTRKWDKPLVIIEQDKECSANGPLRRQGVSYGDHPLSVGNTSIWHLYFKDAEIAEQIDRDLLRTHPEMKFFSGDSSISCRTRQAMRNILLIFAKLNPDIRYVQGMNEVLAPLYYVFITDPLEKDTVRITLGQ
ncbi:Tbc1 domain family member [Thalictrum thalictroides]|uniref:Tbc1 domain family member n=1 Tax=Thalictrum thalictroides TaxID=46969 RepID=A0A7J6VDH9_THATH|nr:Tbc1 domain family member [Thalictrum thalictroides]